MITIRKCNKCNYETVICGDNLKKRKCKHCDGNLEIIAKEIK